MESRNESSSTPIKRDSLLPLSRIKIIMKSSPETENIGQQTLFLVAKATEMFVKFLAKEAYSLPERGKHKTLDYTLLSETVQKLDCMSFLKDILPRKITVKEYKEILRRNQREKEENGSSSDSS